MLSVESQLTFERNMSLPSSMSKNKQSLTPASRRFLYLSSSSILNMEAKWSSETAVDFQWTIWGYIPEDRILQIQHSENLRSWMCDYDLTYKCKNIYSSELDFTCDSDKKKNKYVQEFGMETSCDKATWRAGMELNRIRVEVKCVRSVVLRLRMFKILVLSSVAALSCVLSNLRYNSHRIFVFCYQIFLKSSYVRNYIFFLFIDTREWEVKCNICLHCTIVRVTR
jgi:hypothetical protein